MYDLILAQVGTAPSAPLPTEWAIWIIGILLSFIASIFLFIKWIIGLLAKKTDSLVKEIKIMHAEGVSRLDIIKDSQIRMETKLDIGLMDIKVDTKENKYAIQTLNTKIKCQEQ